MAINIYIYFKDFPSAYKSMQQRPMKGKIKYVMWVFTGKMLTI